MDPQSANVKSRPANLAEQLLKKSGLAGDSAEDARDVGEVEDAASQQEINDGKCHGR
jgi:hypothetical protein